MIFILYFSNPYHAHIDDDDRHRQTMIVCWKVSFSSFAPSEHVNLPGQSVHLAAHVYSKGANLIEHINICLPFCPSLLILLGSLPSLPKRATIKVQLSTLCYWCVCALLWALLMINKRWIGTLKTLDGLFYLLFSFNALYRLDYLCHFLLYHNLPIFVKKLSSEMCNEAI